MLELIGQGWKTDATAASMTARSSLQVRPVQGTAAPEAELVFRKSIDTGTPSWVDMWKMYDDGTFAGFVSARGKIRLTGPTDTGVYIDDSGIQVNIITSGFPRATFTASAIQPPGAGYTIGAAALPYDSAYVGSSGSDPTCDSNHRGQFRTFFAAGGASDEFRVCMKAAADTYAWRAVYTAP
jgi:hypothetical protein